jgi:hypothetical protein
MTSRDAKSTVFRVFGLQGQLVRDFIVPSNPPSISFDMTTRLWRYLNAPLERSNKRTKVTWTDFSGREWTQTVAPESQYFAPVVQAAGDCFYWLEGSNATVTLAKTCRPSR